MIVICDVWFRNNDGYITKQEMMQTIKKLSEKQVSLLKQNNSFVKLFEMLMAKRES